MHAEVVGICGETGEITPEHVNQMRCVAATRLPG